MTTQIRRSRATLDPAPSTTPLAEPHVTASCPSVIVAVAWRYKDAAKEQARRGLISWSAYRQYCADVDRIKRARLRAAEDAARLPVTAANMSARNRELVIAGLMRDRHTGNLGYTYTDRERESAENTRAFRRAVVAASLRAAPELSDREHARRTGATDKTVGSVRRDLEESAEIPHFLRRVDPRTGKQSQPSHRRARRTAPFAVKAVV
jgi:hypothetical protein